MTGCLLDSVKDGSEVPFNSCYLKRSAGDRQGGGDNTVRNDIVIIFLYIKIKYVIKSSMEEKNTSIEQKKEQISVSGLADGHN